MQQTFSINNDEIVRGEYFSHSNEPALTFNSARNLVYVNAVSLKRLPDMEYALFVISSSEKRLSILPCDTGERDAVRLRSGGLHRNKPRQVRCHTDFADKMISLMNWKRDCRYTMIGYTAKSGSDTIIAFDLSSAERFSLGERTSEVPIKNNDGFGPVFDAQQKDPLIRIIDQDIEISNTEAEDESGDEI
jgi:hypothetical protein